MTQYPRFCLVSLRNQLDSNVSLITQEISSTGRFCLCLRHRTFMGQWNEFGLLVLAGAKWSSSNPEAPPPLEICRLGDAAMLRAQPTVGRSSQSPRAGYGLSALIACTAGPYHGPAKERAASHHGAGKASCDSRKASFDSDAISAPSPGIGSERPGPNSARRPPAWPGQARRAPARDHTGLGRCRSARPTAGISGGVREDHRGSGADEAAATA
jgi:hypothetical protein